MIFINSSLSSNQLIIVIITQNTPYKMDLVLRNLQYCNLINYKFRHEYEILYFSIILDVK